LADRQAKRQSPLASPSRREADDELGYRNPILEVLAEPTAERPEDPLDDPKYFHPVSGKRLDHLEQCPRPTCGRWTDPYRTRLVVKGRYSSSWTACWFRCCCGKEWDNGHEPLEEIQTLLNQSDEKEI
jgi:hypothetical protein